MESTLRKLWSHIEHNEILSIFKLENILYVFAIDVVTNLYSGKLSISLTIPEFLEKEQEDLSTIVIRSLKNDYYQMPDLDSFIEINHKDLKLVQEITQDKNEYIVYIDNNEQLNIFINNDLSKEDETILALLGTIDKMKLTKFIVDFE